MALVDYVGDLGALANRPPARPTLSVRQPPMPEADAYAPANGPMSDVGQFLGTDQFSQMMLNGQPPPQQTSTPEAPPQPPSATGRLLAPLPAEPSAQPQPKRDSAFKRFVGNLGDALLVGSGGEAIYGPKKEQEQFVDALSRYVRNPDDDAAFQGMLVNPDYAKVALELRSKHQAWQTGQVDQAAKLDQRAMQVLGSAHDQASYDRARNIVGQMYKRFNVDPAELGLPDVFSPDIVSEIRRRGSSSKDQLDDSRLNRRLDWDIEDDEFDNERADEREDGLAVDRDARLEEARRNNQRRDATSRRGQDIGSTDRRRGQDLRPRGGGKAGPSATGPAMLAKWYRDVMTGAEKPGRAPQARTVRKSSTAAASGSMRRGVRSSERGSGSLCAVQSCGLW